MDLATTENVKWVARLGSAAFGNPTVAGGKVFIGTNNGNPRDPQHQGDRSILMCFDEQTGAFLWQLVIPKLEAGRVNDWPNLGLLSSPTLDGDRVFLVTTRCEVLCLTTEGLANGNTGPFRDEGQYIAGPGQPRAFTGPKDADIVWRYDMIHELGVFPHNASNCSILIVGDLLYVCTSNGMDWTHSNVPSPNSPSLIALNKHTGELVAEDNAGIGRRIMHSQWSSPSTGKVDGRQLIFFGGGDGFCYAFDAVPRREGAETILTVVWKVDCNPAEYKTKNGKPISYPSYEGPSEIVATPVFWRNRVYVATGQDPEHLTGVGNLTCIDATRANATGTAGVLWSYKGIQRSISTVAITPDELLFIADFSGFLHCLDAETGKVYWVHDAKSHIWGSTLVADGKVYVGDEDGDVLVLAAGKQKKLLSQMDVGGSVYSTPVVANGVLFIANQQHLWAIREPRTVQHAVAGQQH